MGAEATSGSWPSIPALHQHSGTSSQGIAAWRLPARAHGGPPPRKCGGQGDPSAGHPASPPRGGAALRPGGDHGARAARRIRVYFPITRQESVQCPSPSLRTGLRPARSARSPMPNGRSSESGCRMATPTGRSAARAGCQKTCAARWMPSSGSPPRPGRGRSCPPRWASPAPRTAR